MSVPRDRFIFPGQETHSSGSESTETESNEESPSSSLELTAEELKILADLQDRLKYAPEKITRDADGYITEIQKLVGNHKITRTITRDSEKRITLIKVRIKEITEFE